SFLIVLFVPRSQILPSQARLQRQFRRDLPVVVDEGRERGGRVQRSRAAERAGARRAVAKQEIGNRIARELPVEREAAARRDFGQLLVAAVLGLNAEPDVVRALDPARGIQDADNVFRRALRNAALAVAAEAVEREAGASVID